MKANLECDASGFLRLCDVSRLTERELPYAMHRIASKMCDDAQTMAPVYAPKPRKDGKPSQSERKGGGRLRQSIAFRTGRYGNMYWGQIGTNVFYAPYQEFGTGQRGSAIYVDKKGETHVTEGLSFKSDWKGIPPNPYIRPALYNNGPYIEAMIHDAVRRSVRRNLS